MSFSGSSAACNWYTPIAAESTTSWPTFFTFFLHQNQASPPHTCYPCTRVSIWGLEGQARCRHRPIFWSSVRAPANPNCRVTQSQHLHLQQHPRRAFGQWVTWSCFSEGTLRWQRQHLRVIYQAPVPQKNMQSAATCKQTSLKLLTTWATLVSSPTAPP
jgi:hypothetical protein